ncbi:hypothetical protein KW801_02910, partial [Candidatus Saccharibacteria bacterium]|nr:hypothetical protein [Candidatus Saccharibacteria bacterium]
RRKQSALTTRGLTPVRVRILLSERSSRMISMAAELTELRNKPLAWAGNLIMEFAMVGAAALALAFPLHLVLNPVSSVLGYPHGIGGFWSSTLVVLGIVTVVSALVYVRELFDGDVSEDDTTALIRRMVLLGIAAWVATWILTGSAT